MTNAYVLMTALPPTLGHLDLINFARNLSVEQVYVILNTQPDEPYGIARVNAIYNAVKGMSYPTVTVKHYSEYIQQEPRGDNDREFWGMWKHILRSWDFMPGDYIVASEPYGARLAREVGGAFMPYDRDRVVRTTKGTDARNNPAMHWDDILPEFRPVLATRVTVFGAESVGKSTLVSDIHQKYPNGTVMAHEWARPYLEMAGPEITLGKMKTIFQGQSALQNHVGSPDLVKPVILQDTDLFSTLGYLRMWDPKAAMDLEHEWAHQALYNASDLYIIPRSNIPFEPDPLRYGGDVRETADSYWIGICKEFDLNYVVLGHADRESRVFQASGLIKPLVDAKLSSIKYQRRGAEYEKGVD